jgi:hypothetical protein
MELESALNKALSSATPNKFKVETQVSSEGPRLPEFTDSICNNGGK